VYGGDPLLILLLLLLSSGFLFATKEELKEEM